jgi:hypothetical protein
LPAIEERIRGSTFVSQACLSHPISTIGKIAQTARSDLRIPYGGIGIECGTYSRLRTRMDEFTIRRGPELTASRQFDFLKLCPVTSMPTLVASAVSGGLSNGKPTTRSNPNSCRDLNVWHRRDEQPHESGARRLDLLELRQVCGILGVASQLSSLL